jgi:hypothetical protein
MTDPLFDAATATLTNPDTKDTYVVGKAKGRKPAWVTAWLQTNSLPAVTIIDVKETIKEKIEMPKIEKTEKTEKTEKVNSTTGAIFENPTYKTFINSLDKSNIIFKGELTPVTSIKDVIFEITFKMIQHNTTPMCFNNDFGGIQKTNETGSPILSPECVMRHGFGQNDLQNNFTVDGFKTYNFLVRGGIRTDKNEKNGNVSLTKTINASCVASNFKKVQNDRLGFKADADKQENYLNEEIGYLNTTFDVRANFYLLSFIKNIMGTDFAQTNALKLLKATDAECEDFIKSLIPTKGNVLECDAIIKNIIDTFSSNLKRFSHRGIYAEFEIADINLIRRSF